MKSINPDPLTPDQAIDILHRVAAAEGAPIFKDCADLIVRLHMDNFLLTKHRDEFDRLHDEARAQCDSLRTQNEKLTKSERDLQSKVFELLRERDSLRTQNRELRECVEKIASVSISHDMTLWCRDAAKSILARIKEVEGCE